MKVKNDFRGHTQHYYISGSDFMLNYTPFEYDEVSGRYYFLEPSISMTSKAGREGGLVRRRISKVDYDKALAECQSLLIGRVFEQDDSPREELIETAAVDMLRYTADRLEGNNPTINTFVPRISVESLIEDITDDLLKQVKSHRYPDINPCTAAHELHGFIIALERLGLIEEEDCYVKPDTFKPKLGEDFIHSLGGAPTRQTYSLGIELLRGGCPKNDCMVYRNTFEMCLELDEQIDRVTGLARRTLEAKLYGLQHELFKMYLNNHALEEYRVSRLRPQREETPGDRMPLHLKNLRCNYEPDPNHDPYKPWPKLPREHKIIKSDNIPRSLVIDKG